MKKVITILVLVIALVYMTGIALAQPAVPISEACYKDATCMQTSDPAKWDFSKVDWTNKGIYENRKIYGTSAFYNNQNFYANLPENKYQLLNYKLVNYNYINQNKINGPKFVKDFDCEGCSFSTTLGRTILGRPNLQSDFITFSADGKIKHRKGDEVSIGRQYSNLVFTATPDGIIVYSVKDQKIDLTKMSSDSFSFKVESGAKKTLIFSGTEIPLSDGQLRFKNGELFVQGGKKAQVWNVDVNARSDVKLYVDGKRHDDCKCAYVSMNPTGGRIITVNPNQQQHILNFRPGNPFFDVGIDNTFLIRQETGIITIDTETITTASGTKIKIPKVNFEVTPSGFVVRGTTIQDGSAYITVSDRGKIEHRTYRLSAKLTEKIIPMSLTVVDSQGKSLLGSPNQPQTLYVTENGIVSAQTGILEKADEVMNKIEDAMRTDAAGAVLVASIIILGWARLFWGLNNPAP